MHKYAALISYTGTSFCGWQKQKGSAASGKPSIQETLETALTRMTGEVTPVVGSGRTDSGVHASGQVAHFLMRKKEWDPEILRKGLNALVKPRIQLLSVQPAPIEFHAQHAAERKQYSFYFQQGSCALPFLAPYSWWRKSPLDVDAMNRGLSHLKGKHDFKPFQASGARPGPTVREILEAEATWDPIVFPGTTPVDSNPFGLIRVRLIGTGFLKQMVRGIAGTLMQIGEGRRAATCIRDILLSGDRAAVGATAPGRALWLERVWYPDLRW